jgi:hypothetical protein
MANMHDAYRPLASQNISYAVAGGASAQSAAFGSQTFFIRVSAAGVVDATNTGVKIALGSNPVASATSTLLPLNWVTVLKTSPGQKIAAIGASAAVGSLSVTELDG